MDRKISMFLNPVVSIIICLIYFSPQVFARHGELPNRIPEAAPYNVSEAQTYPPPYEPAWQNKNNVGDCASCHPRVYDEWNGSMKANAWRDPGWRGAFLLVSRLTSTDGDCDIPNPPDGTSKSAINPFANGDCTSTFNIGTSTTTTSGSGSMMDDFCARCHMPTNYIDQVPLSNVTTDSGTGKEHGLVRSTFDPTSDNGTGVAFAEVTSLQRNTTSGQLGIFCAVCHANIESRHTPYHNYKKSGTEYYPAVGTSSRANLLPSSQEDMLSVPDAAKENLGFGIGAGAYRLSPHAISYPERFGPLSYRNYTSQVDPYVSDVFNITYNYQQGNFAMMGHLGYYQMKFERAEFCGACHDVTNPMTIKNTEGKWVGGFPIERTYTEWLQSRYADRPGNSNYDSNFKRDCQTCHMQQDFGQPGTALTLYSSGNPISPVTGQVCTTGPIRPAYYTHHFVGGNTYVSQMIGATADGGALMGGMNGGGGGGMHGGSGMHGGGGMGGGGGGGATGTPEPWPELSAASFSSSDKQSVYNNAYFNNAYSGRKTHHARLAWDRLRNAVTLNVTGPASADAGSEQAININIINDGSGHNFPTGFPEGRNAWVSVRAWDTATGSELEIKDTLWNRTSTGVGYLTTSGFVDPNFPGCNYSMPAGSPDPYAYQFRAVATLGDGCPTLDLPYATPANLVVNENGMPIDSNGTVIDKDNPDGLPRYTDIDGDGDLFDDSFLIDTRLRPLPNDAATLNLNRYKVVIPGGTVGPVAVTAAIYYQSFEAQVSKKFLGNLADTDTDFKLEPCVLKGLCDGRVPAIEPAVVEGAAPVPMEVKNWVIKINGQTDSSAPNVVSVYPPSGHPNAYQDVVPKIRFNEAVQNVESKFTLVDSGGQTLPAVVDQVGDGTWAIFPNGVFLTVGATYTAKVASGVCDYNNNCTTSMTSWSFTVSSSGAGDTTIALGY